MELSLLTKLNEYQLNVFQECIEKIHCGISMPMGAGKTRTSLVLSLEITTRKILIVCEKSLINDWINEIELVTENKISYTVYHSEFMKNFKQIISIDQIQERIVITTPEVVRKFYNELNLEDILITKRIVNEGTFNQHIINDYNRIPAIIPNGGVIFGTDWGSLIVDEFHKMSTLSSAKSKAILCIYAERKWALSGTFFAEPKPDKILPYFLYIQHSETPNNLPDFGSFIRSNGFSGLNQYIVMRKESPVIIETIEEKVIVHMRPEEELIYKTLREIILNLYERSKELRGVDPVQVKKISGYLLSLLIYLRQSICNPLIPISGIYINLRNLDRTDELSNILRSNFTKLNIDNYLSNTENIISSRMQRLIEISQRHEKVVVFTSFRKNITLLEYTIRDRPFITIEGNMNINRRCEILDSLHTLDNFIMPLTYKIGGSGLNIQSANCVIFFDYEWNISETKQALSRVVRQGQTQTVYVYYLVSNTGVENAILKKQLDKKNASSELENGPIKTKVDTIKTEEIINILSDEIINEKMEKLYF